MSESPLHVRSKPETLGSAASAASIELEPHIRIGVLADRSGTSLQLVLGSLERVRPVRFQALTTSDHGATPNTSAIPSLSATPSHRATSKPGATSDGLAAIVVLDQTPPMRFSTIPRLTLATPYGDDQHAEETAHGQGRPVTLADNPLLARPLRGRTIPDNNRVSESTLAPLGGARILAAVEDRPVWWHVEDGAGWLDVSLYPFAEPRPGETLRDHLRAGRFMGLLPLLRFVDHLLGANGWTPPPLRASFVVDDPNLHWHSYGYIDYGELIAHAAQHRYHLGLATVPLDSWMVNRRAASLIRSNPSAVSLLMHGNDHRSRELGRLRDDHQAERAIAQAQRRIVKLERRSGVKVERVMAPPHGACSEMALQAMLSLGIEAACISRPYPWRDGLPAPTPLAAWGPAELVAGGMPVLPRLPLSASREDLALRALLGQPLILYGHHGDFVAGLDALAEAAADINALGEVRWGPLGGIARSNYCTRRVGDVLQVKLYARRVSLQLPPDVTSLQVLLDVPFGTPAWRQLAIGDQQRLDLHFDGIQGISTLASVPTAGALELKLISDRALDPFGVPSPGIKPWPLLRRIMVEGRDRMQPLLP